jgi:hypothetical protein
MAGPTWDEFERIKERSESPDATRFDQLCAQVLTSGSGAELLKLMRARTVEQRSPPRAHEAQLREDEAVRRFVASLEAARDRGNLPKPKPPAA